MCRRVGGGKKYKSEVGSWENFSWDRPTGGNGGATTLKKMAENNNKPSLIN